MKRYAVFIGIVFIVAVIYLFSMNTASEERIEGVASHIRLCELIMSDPHASEANQTRAQNTLEDIKTYNPLYNAAVSLIQEGLMESRLERIGFRYQACKILVDDPFTAWHVKRQARRTVEELRADALFPLALKLYGKGPNKERIFESFKGID